MNVSIARDSTTNPISGPLPFVEKPKNLGIEWDAENRLLAINQGNLRSEFSYDGESRRVRIVEKSGSTVTSDRRFLWCMRVICEERSSSGGTVVKRHFDDGVQQAAQAFFYSRDHLGSVRELSDGAAAIKARYDYDPYGKRSVVSEDQAADFGFTGHYEHAVSETTLALFRPYHARLARWLSEDPSGIVDGPNLYVYALNSPAVFVDPFGLQAEAKPPPGQTYPGNLTTGQREQLKAECNARWPGSTPVSYEVRPPTKEKPIREGLFPRDSPAMREEARQWREEFIKKCNLRDENGNRLRRAYWITPSWLIPYNNFMLCCEKKRADEPCS